MFSGYNYTLLMKYVGKVYRTCNGHYEKYYLNVCNLCRYAQLHVYAYVSKFAKAKSAYFTWIPR